MVMRKSEGRGGGTVRAVDRDRGQKGGTFGFFDSEGVAAHSRVVERSEDPRIMVTPEFVVDPGRVAQPRPVWSAEYL